VLDVKKEIKLSDLVRNTAKAGERSKGTAKGHRGPRPRLLARKSPTRELVGVKVGATQLTAARVDNNNGQAHLLQLARQPLPHGIVSDGEVLDGAALAAALKEFFTVNKLPRRGVRLGIATNHVGVRIIEITGIDDEQQLANAVLFRAHDVISIPVEEAIIDYRVISEKIDESGTLKRRILLVAAYREPIERYTAAFKSAGIELVGIDLEAFALLRAVGAPPAEDTTPTAAVVVVNAGHQRTTLAVSDGKICGFTRVLGWGGSKLALAIGRELNITVEEAQDILIGLSLEPAAETDPDPDPGLGDRLSRARAAARRELQVLARELVASLQFYQGQPESPAISEILLAGGTSRIPGFAAELERLTGVHVRLADPLARVQDDTGVDERNDLASLAIAIGLGVDD
jgi:type IV pilus assembly protein PilM